MISTNDFEYMGAGIERRFNRCAAWWAPHLACTREFVERHVPQAGSIAVLGAGRLFDVDLKKLLTRCDTIHLFDADPRCVATWKREAGDLYGERVVPHLCDLTGSLDEWTRGLSKARRGGYLNEYILSLEPLKKSALPRFDGIVSLNLLGQIPLYWRDRVRSTAPQLDCVGREALIKSMGALQHAHLQTLHESASLWSVVISDTEYYFYDIDESEWRVEPALFGEAEQTWQGSHTRVQATTKDSWLWHIAPQLIESDEEGEIHRVEARVYRYNDRHRALT